MLESLKQAGKSIGYEINHAWESLSEGWRELLSRSSHALTHFSRHKGSSQLQEGRDLDAFPRWGLLAGELEETRTDVVVRVELPGMEKSDCTITIENNILYVSGEKHSERESADSTYHLMERAYGSFQRKIALPGNVNTDKAEASFKNGVLTIRLPKEGRDSPRSVPVS